MKLKANATKTVLTLARIAENHAWCQDFLENILQELEALIWEDRNCPLLNDLVKETSATLLWDACISDKSIEQQTGVRLLLLVCKLTCDTFIDNNNFH